MHVVEGKHSINFICIVNKNSESDWFPMKWARMPWTYKAKETGSQKSRNNCKIRKLEQPNLDVIDHNSYPFLQFWDLPAFFLPKTIACYIVKVHTLTFYTSDKCGRIDVFLLGYYAHKSKVSSQTIYWFGH